MKHEQLYTSKSPFIGNRLPLVVELIGIVCLSGWSRRQAIRNVRTTAILRALVDVSTTVSCYLYSFSENQRSLRLFSRTSQDVRRKKVSVFSRLWKVLI